MSTASSFSPMECLRAEHQAIADLLALMQQEQQHLVHADADALAGITEKKAALINQAGNLAKQRHAMLAAAGFAEQESSMRDWLASIQKEELAQAWEDLLNITRDAKEINRINGMLINKQMANTQNALNALQAPSPNQQMYGPKGQSAGIATSRRLVVG